MGGGTRAAAREEKELIRARDALAAERRRNAAAALAGEEQASGGQGLVARRSAADPFNGPGPRFADLVLQSVFGRRPRRRLSDADQVARSVARPAAPRQGHAPRLPFPARASAGHRAGESADGLGDAVVHDHGQLRCRFRRRTSGTARTCSTATATACSAPTSSTTAATSRWGIPGTISISPLARPPGGLGGLARGLSADPALQVVELAKQLRRGDGSRTRNGSRVSDAGEAAMRDRRAGTKP